MTLAGSLLVALAAALLVALRVALLVARLVALLVAVAGVAARATTASPNGGGVISGTAS